MNTNLTNGNGQRWEIMDLAFPFVLWKKTMPFAKHMFDIIAIFILS